MKMVTASNGSSPTPRFSLGQTLATRGALKAILAGGHSPAEFLKRHHHGDWGDLSEHDRRANETALKDGSRIFSVYQLSRHQRLWVITEAVGDDGRRASTCLMLPDEY
jgi:hypothetical protein